MKKIVIILFLLCNLTINQTFFDTCFGQDTNEFVNIRANVVNIISTDIEQDIPSQNVELMIVEGIHKGEKYEAKYNLNLNYSGEINMNLLKVNDGVFVDLSQDEDGTVKDIFITQIIRDTYLAYLLIGFCILLIIVGRGKGIKAILSLSLTIVSIMMILLPAILQGYDPILVTVTICVFNIFISLIIISGWNKKTLAAILGTTGGVIIAGSIAYYIGTMAKITGLGQEETQMLLEIPQI